jgi:hypothetical protein
LLPGENGGSRVLDRCLGYTDKQSVKRNRSFNAWRSSRFVIRTLQRLKEDGAAALTGLEHTPCGTANGMLTNSRIFLLLVSQLGRLLKRRIESTLFDFQWTIAFKLQDLPDPARLSLDGLTFLRPPPDRFWADPFVVKHNGTFYLFFEELLYATQKGHLSVLEVDAMGRAGKPVTILEQDYHLSYPFVFQYQDQMYMIPETSQNKTIEIYRAARFPLRWQLHQVLMKDIQAVDTTLAEIDGLWWMFTNVGITGAPPEEELCLFYSDTPFGPWKPHRKNPVISDCRRGRQAGRLFTFNGQLYRPAQVSTRNRGYSLSINRIVKLNQNEYEEQPVSTIAPASPKDVYGIHTVNHDAGMTVVDIRLRRRRWNAAGNYSYALKQRGRNRQPSAPIEINLV